ncbi:MAG: STAS domain-containing protein [Patescibacteria group bacterium]|nr:STAS domain-containing protein [Patescibacteria group bacterium]
MTEANITVEDVASEDPSKVIKLVRIKGQLDESNVDEKSKEIYALIEQNPKGLNLIFDLENLEYMNSKSIGYLTDWYGKVNEGGGAIALAKPKPNILDILNVVGITQLVQSYATLDEAKFALTKQNG